jgi:hypothetical protein
MSLPMACVAWLLGAGATPAAAPSFRERAAPPSRLACASDGAHYLAVRWDATAAPAADLYDVQCVPAENATSASGPFLSFTSVTSTARIGPLQPQAVRCGVRSHDATAPSIVSGWSAFSQPVRCDVIAGDPSGSPQSTRAAGHSSSIDQEPTRSVAMWRASEFEFMNEV